ncbi:MAG: hypothetical protein ACUVRC_07020 [Desulfotomaculales bacterium]
MPACDVVSINVTPGIAEVDYLAVVAHAKGGAQACQQVFFGIYRRVAFENHAAILLGEKVVELEHLELAVAWTLVQANREARPV